MSTTPSFLAPRTRVSASVAGCSAAVLAWGTSLCMVTTYCFSACTRSSADMSSILQYQQLSVPPLTTSYAPRTNPGHGPLARSTQSHDHTRSATMLLWIGVMALFSHFEMTEIDFIQRTPHVRVQSQCCAHTPAVKSTVLQVHSASYQELHQGFHKVQVRVRVQTTSSHMYLVPSRHLRRCSSTVSDLVNTSYCAYCLTRRTAHVATYVISHNDPA